MLEYDCSLQTGSGSGAVREKAARRSLCGGVGHQAETAQPHPHWLEFYTPGTLGKNTTVALL